MRGAWWALGAGGAGALGFAAGGRDGWLGQFGAAGGHAFFKQILISQF
ncbi:MAG TPA: hypothetical protein PK829_09455 [Promineifilum sp.]|nr:hypothetical protein [Promineifilum sp.]